METHSETNLCSGCHISYTEAQQFNKDDILDFLFAHGVFEKYIQCFLCKKTIKVNRKKLFYSCGRYYTPYKKRRQKCTFNLSLSTETFIDGTRIPIDTVFKLTCIALFYVSPGKTYLANEFKIPPNRLEDWFLSIRDVFIDDVSINTKKLGGEGQIIELDEAESSKFKYPEPWNWVYGGIDHTSRQTFLAPVEHPNDAALRDIIIENVNPGTIIVTNCLKFYGSEVFQSLSESHGFIFVQPEESTLANTIDHRWSEVYREPQLMKPPHSLNHFAMYLFKSKYPEPSERLHAYFVAAAKLYPKKLRGRRRGQKRRKKKEKALARGEKVLSRKEKRLALAAKHPNLNPSETGSPGNQEAEGEQGVVSSPKAYSSDTSRKKGGEGSGVSQRAPAPTYSEKLSVEKMAITRIEHPDVKLTEAEANKIKGELSRRAIQGKDVRISSCHLECGALVVGYANATTEGWLDKQVKELSPFGGITLQLAPARSLVKVVKVSTFVPSSTGATTKKEVMQGLKLQNDLDTDHWEIVGGNSNPNGQFLVMIIDESSLQMLKSLAMRPFLGCERVIFRLHGSKDPLNK